MKLSASLQASANVLFELEYAEKRLEHYRQIVSSGKLKAFLETGKKRRRTISRSTPTARWGSTCSTGPTRPSCRPGTTRPA